MALGQGMPKPASVGKAVLDKKLEPGILQLVQLELPSFFGPHAVL